MDLNSNFQLKRYSGSGSQDLKITQLWTCHDRGISGPQNPSSKCRSLMQMGKKVLVNFWSCHDRDNFWTNSSSSKWCCLVQTVKKPDQDLIILRSWHEFSNQKFELKMGVSVVNGSKIWSDLAKIWVWQSFRYGGHFWPAGPETFPVKTQILLVNGPKDGCTDDPPDLT